MEALPWPVSRRAQDTGKFTPGGVALASLVSVPSESFSDESRESRTPANLEWPVCGSHGPRPVSGTSLNWGVYTPPGPRFHKGGGAQQKGTWSRAGRKTAAPSLELSDDPGRNLSF